MDEIINSDLFITCVNIGAYVLSGFILKALGVRFMNALLPAIVIVISILLMLGIDYDTYERGSELLSFFLGPSVVALGYVLHKQVKSIKKNIGTAMISITIGAVVNLIVINAMFLFFDTDDSIIYSIQPKSVTTPIAISLSEQSDGITSLTVIIVVFTGILGSLIGTPLMKLFRITDPAAQGLALGATSHVIGTARALELGVKSGAMAGLAIGLMGIVTSVLLSFFRDFLL